MLPIYRWKMVFNKGIFKNRLLRTLCLALLSSGASFYIAGYNFGRYLDIAYVKNFLDPALYAKDTLLFHHLDSPYLYFHKAIAYLASWTGLGNNLELLFVILYGIAIFFTMLALIKITDHLFQNWKTTVILLFLFILNCRLLELGEPSLHLTELAPEVMARPLILFSLYFFLRKRYFISLAMAGFAFNIHLGTAGYLLIIYAIYCIYDMISTRQLNILTWLKSWGVCIVLALPTLIPLIGMVSPYEGMEPWMLPLRIYLIYGHTSPTLIFELSPFQLLWSLFGAILIAIAMLKTPLEKAKNRAVLIIFAAVGIMYLVGYIFVDIIPTSLFETIGILRATWFIMVLGLIYAANYLRGALENKYIHASVILLFFLSLIFEKYILWFCSILLLAISFGAEYTKNERLKGLLKTWFPLACLVGLILLNVILKFMPSYQGIIDKILNSLSMPNLMLVVLAIGIISVVLIEFAMKDRQMVFKQIALVSLLLVSVILPFHSISIQSSASQDWKDIQVWSNTTPEGSLFIIPPKYLDFYDYSNRPAVFNLAAMGPMDIYPEKINEVTERLADMGIDLKEVAEQHNWSIQLMEEAWAELTDAQFQALAEKYEAQYIIRERELPLNFKIVYENDTIIVYKTD